MGCDIHLFVEARQPGGPWKLQRVTVPCSWCKGTKVNPPTSRQPGEQCWFCRRHPGLEVGYDHRNYDVFAILANVRNGRAFGGCATGGGFISIDDPRGFPGDMSDDLKRIVSKSDEDDDSWERLKSEYGSGWIGDHSFSHISLAELLAYNWEQVATQVGWVDLETFRAWDAKGGGWPEGWCGDIMGPRIKKISNQEMRALIAGGRIEKNEPCDPNATAHYTQVRWTDTYAKCAGDFHDKFIPALVGLGAALGVEPENVRIVFGFDS